MKNIERKNIFLSWQVQLFRIVVLVCVEEKMSLAFTSDSFLRKMTFTRLTLILLRENTCKAGHNFLRCGILKGALAFRNQLPCLHCILKKLKKTS